jgi:hypothetical protein
VLSAVERGRPAKDGFTQCKRVVRDLSVGILSANRAKAEDRMFEARDRTRTRGLVLELLLGSQQMHEQTFRVPRWPDQSMIVMCRRLQRVDLEGDHAN